MPQIKNPLLVAFRALAPNGTPGTGRRIYTTIRKDGQLRVKLYGAPALPKEVTPAALKRKGFGDIKIIKSREGWNRYDSITILARKAS